MREETKKKRTSFNYQLFYRRTALIVYDIISVVASSFLALLIRYDFEVDTVPAEFLLPIRITVSGPLRGRRSCRTW